LADSVPLWEGVKVYDNHLTQEEFEKKHGMRSPANEWLGTIVKPRWDKHKNQLRGVFKVVEERLANKLKSAWEQGVLGSIGLSIDTFPIVGSDEIVEGERLSVIEGFKKILSVDLVGDPAAGGGFNRLLAAKIKEINNMDEETSKEFVARDELKDIVSAAVADALAVKEAETEENLDDLSDEDVQDELDERDLSKAQVEAQKAQQIRDKAIRETKLARTELMIERKLEKAKLPEKFESVIRAQFADRIVEAEEIDKAIKNLKEAQASLDPSGKVRAGGAHDVTVGIVDDDRFALEFYRLMMGNEDFKAMEHVKEDIVKDRISEAGAPELPRYNRISSLLYDYFGGDPLMDGRAMEAATTSTLTTVVKNTVNIMTANSYSMRERWFEAIVRTEEVDTIDDSTLARVYGVNTLSTVLEGAAYTELAIADDEETASFVKRGNYIGITLETLMRDKINYVRRIPTVLADTWFNTQSSLVSSVFTVNTATGPVLGTTGALFNATATTTAGGHANLLTTALSHAQFSTVRTAMRKQTDQPLGVGRKLLLTPRYLLVPVDLEVTALDIRNSELVPEADGAGTTGNQTVNNFRNSFDVIVVPDWTDTNNWAVVADPNIAAAIWLIYPRGQRTPQIFSADSETSGAMFTNDELRFKVRLMTYRFSATYDCAPVSDFRPLHKSNV
jgi:hypothetical protein